jgi:transposase
MAHARRKFFDSLPKDKARESDATSVARQAIHYCDQMFSLEHFWKELSAKERYKKRQSELKPLLKKFSDWCYKKSVSVLPSGKLGAAFQYCLNHMDKVMNILKDGRLECPTTEQSEQSKRSSWDARTGSFHRAALAPKP